MRRLFTSIFYPGGSAVIFSLAAFAQGPFSNQAPAQNPVANQLLLSGRSAQNGSVTATQSPVPGTTASANTLNVSVQTQGPYSGSASSTAKLPFSGKLSLNDAIQRGLEYNLGQVGLNHAVRQAEGQRRVARSALLPNLNGDLLETVQQINLRALGVRFNSPIPAFSIPSIVGPFNYFDLRAKLTQTVANLTQLNNYRSAKENMQANEESARDARDLVVLAVGGAYLQTIAAKARVEAERSQVETANALYQQASQKRAVGLLSLTDLNRSQVEFLIEQERLVTLENDFAKQKINLARLTGLPANDQYEITDDVPFSPAPPLDMESALKEAQIQREDIKAAESQIRAAEFARSAARAERLPSLSLSADYGVIGTNPSQAHGTFTVTGTLSVPIWQGGRAEGDIEQAEAALAQRRAELEDLRNRVEADVRSAYLDLQAANRQVDVARGNLEVSKQTLDLTRQRFDTGVSDNVEVVQAQESVAGAQLDYINSVFAHNVAKLSLARAIGGAAGHLPAFLQPR